jgi:hypothetical protein
MWDSTHIPAELHLTRMRKCIQINIGGACYTEAKCVLHALTVTSVATNCVYIYIYIYIWILQKEPTICNRVVELIIQMLRNCSTCFGRHTAHHQKLKNCNCSLWFYIRFGLLEPSQRPATKNVCKTQRLQLQFLSSWWWAMCRPKHVEQLRNTGIINSTTQLHLVGSFYEIFNTMHWSINIKFKLHVNKYTKCTAADHNCRAV